MMKVPNFVAVDLETTGLDFEKDEIIEVALVRFEDSKPTESVDFLVKPAEAVLRPFIESLTGISKAELEESEDFASVAGKICAFIGDLPLVAHNASFDSKFLKRSLNKVGVPYDDHVFWDSLTLSRIAYQDTPNHRLDTLVQALGIERSRAHRALPDADACGRLFVMAYEKIAQMDPWLVDALTRVSAGSDLEKLFGAASGKELAAPSYALPEVEQSSGTLPSMAVPRVSEFFKEGGLLSFSMEGFKPREGQADFASAVERNMHKGGLCVMEAPTGSGKTLAYLVSAANKAVSGERVLISTATRALQEQLWNHDIPQLVNVFNGFLKPAILKGRDNYICLRKFEEVLRSSANLLLPEEIDSFMALIPWVLQTESGDINESHAFNHARNHVLWSKVSSSAASCQGENCPHYKKCPALCAKRRAMASNLVLVNHSLFLADLSLDFALLPTYEHVVFDEAHRLPECSNQAFGRSLSFFSFRNVAKMLVPSRGKHDGLIAELQSRLAADDSAHKEECEQLVFDIGETEKALHRFFMKIGKKIQKNKIGKSGLVYTKGILAEYDVDPKGVMDPFAAMKARADKLFAELAGVAACRDLVKDAYGCVDELNRFIQDFEFLVKAGRSDWVFYLEEPFNPHTLKMLAYPLHSGSVWRTKFYPWIKSATFTSATLAVQGDLSYFAKRMGMSSLTGGKRPFMRAYSEPPVQESRRKVMVTRYLPKPSDPAYADALNECLSKVLPDVEENTLVLFTNIAQMMKAQTVLAPLFAEKNKLLLCQYVDGALDGLVSMFRASRGACLLGCQSLWEGVDFPGDALKLLVIAKLPFPNPSDPLVAGIAAEMKERGENTFKDFFVPEAYMEMRQGLGRLLRSEEDSGKVLILDNRIVKESYGKTFARIWNFKHVQANNVSDIQNFLK